MPTKSIQIFNTNASPYVLIISIDISLSTHTHTHTYRQIHILSYAHKHIYVVIHTFVTCINSIQWRSVIAGFCNSVIVRNDATNSLSTPTMYKYGVQSRMLLSRVRKSRVNCLHSFSMSSVSMCSHGDERQSSIHDSMTWTKSHSCFFF